MIEDACTAADTKDVELVDNPEASIAAAKMVSSPSGVQADTSLPGEHSSLEVEKVVSISNIVHDPLDQPIEEPQNPGKQITETAVVLRTRGNQQYKKTPLLTEAQWVPVPSSRITH